MRILILASLPSYLYYFLVYIIGMLVSRWLGVKGFGSVAFAIVVANTLSFVFELGLSKAALQVIPKYAVKKNFGGVRGFIHGSPALIIIVSILFVLLTYFSYELLRPFLRGGEFHDFMTLVVAAFAIAVARFLAGCLRSRGNFILGSILYWVVCPLVWLLLIAFAHLVPFITLTWSLTLHFYVVAWVLATFLSLIFVLLYFSNKVWHATPHYDWGQWIKLGIAYSANSFSLFFVNQVGLIVLGTISSEQIHTGIYAAMLNIANILYFALISTNNYFLPLISAAHAKGDNAKVNAILQHRFKYLSLFVAIFLVIVVLVGKYLLGFYGQIYMSYELPLIFLVCVCLCYPLGLCCQYYRYLWSSCTCI